MKTDREYPAAFTTPAAWFAVDEDGCLAAMGSDYLGPKPADLYDKPRFWLYNENGNNGFDLFLQAMKAVRFTNEQALGLLNHAITPADDRLPEPAPFNGGIVAQLDRTKTDTVRRELRKCLLKRHICISKELNIRMFLFEDMERFFQFLHSNPDAIQRLAFIDLAIFDDEPPAPAPGFLHAEDVPIYYFTDNRETDYMERKTAPVHPAQVEQAPTEYQTDAVRFPVKFKEWPYLEL